MAQAQNVDPSPFYLPGGPVGILLLHGFTGSPPEMRRVGDYLHERGFTVSGPLLPGHGTTPEDLALQTWGDWTRHAAEALAQLQAQCQTVYIGGLSMGALIALFLGARHPELAGVIAYSPALRVSNHRLHLAPLLKGVITQQRKGPSDLVNPSGLEYLWSYDVVPSVAGAQLLNLIRAVQRRLPRLAVPLLVIHSTRDRTIRKDSAALTCELAGSTDKRLVTIHESGHCITVDGEWQHVADLTYNFMLEHSQAPHVEANKASEEASTQSA